MKKKLFSFLMMLCVSIGAWAADISADGLSGATVTTKYGKTQTLVVSTPGALATWIASVSGDNFDPNNPYGGLGVSSDFEALKISGTLNATDFTALKTTTIESLSRFPNIDMSGVTLAEGVDASVINNVLFDAATLKESSANKYDGSNSASGAGAQYVIIPPSCAGYADGGSGTSFPVANWVVGYGEEAASNKTKQNDGQNAGSDNITVKSGTKTLGVYTKEAGTLHDALYYLGTVGITSNTSGMSATVDNIRLAGHFNWYDINNDNSYWGQTWNDKSLSVTGLTGLDANNLKGYVDVRKVIFDDMTVTVYGTTGTHGEADCYSGGKRIDNSVVKGGLAWLSKSCTILYLPETTGSDGTKNRTLHESFLTSHGNLSYVYMPNNFQAIKASAFGACNKIRCIWSNDDESPNEDEALSGTEDGNFYLGSGINHIYTAAFNSQQYYLKDLYVLTTSAPICEVGAFSVSNTMGNNGFTPEASGGVTRETFKTGTGWITMLHYPASTDGTNVRRYTDVYRDYSIADAKGSKDGNGNTIMWPNYSEFTRSFEQGRTGYLWNAWDVTRDINYGVISSHQGQLVSQEMGDELFTENGSNNNYVFYPSSRGVSEVTSTNAAYYNADYRGWHEFILAAYTKPDDDYPFNFGGISDNEWWTLCLPFDMTKAEVKRYFGDEAEGTFTGDNAYPKLCTLVGVKRDIAAGTITLQFGEDLVKGKESTDVVIEAGKPYMIKPKMPDAVSGSTWTPANHILHSTDAETHGPKTAAQLFTMLKNGIVTVNATVVNGSEENTYKYSFVGSFNKWYLPQYSYYLGWDNVNSTVAFFYQKSLKVDNRSWNTYTAIVCPNYADNIYWASPTSYIPTGTELESAHWVTYEDDTAKTSKAVDDTIDGFTMAKYLTVFDIDLEEEEMGVATIIEDASLLRSNNGEIYNLNGQTVGKSIEGLSKGLYIINGKKYVVK